MTTYRFTVEVHDDDAGPGDGGKPWAAVTVEDVTIEAGLGATPWAALGNLNINWDEVVVSGTTPTT